MFKFFEQVLGYLEVFFTSLNNTLNSLLQAGSFLLTSSDTIFRLLGFMPKVLSAFVIIAIVFAFIKFLLGR